MKPSITLLLLFTYIVGMAQANKSEAGDLGIRYGVSFDGTAIQGLTFSGMVTKNMRLAEQLIFSIPHQPQQVIIFKTSFFQTLQSLQPKQ